MIQLAPGDRRSAVTPQPRVLVGSLLSPCIEAVILPFRSRAYRRLWEAEELDSDANGTPDVYESTTTTWRLFDSFPRSIRWGHSGSAALSGLASAAAITGGGTLVAKEQWQVRVLRRLPASGSC